MRAKHILNLFILTVFCVFNSASFAEELTIAFWNVENLFDNYQDRNSSSEDLFVPSALKEKLRKDGEIIRELNADILGLMEVENRAILKRLINEELADLGYQYHALIDEPNDRGIDCAIISRKPFLCYSYDVPDFYRGILTARFSHNGQPFYVIVNHWKSRFGGGEELRMNCSKRVLQIVDEFIPEFEGDVKTPVIIGGDFNDNDSDPSVLHLERNGLTNTLKTLSADDRWTLLYDNRDKGLVEFDTFDHIFVNKNCLLGKGLKWKSSSVERPMKMLGTRTIRGVRHVWPDDDYQDHIGYSDHFPVVAKFELPTE